MTTIPSNEDSPAHSNVILSPETTATDDTSEPEHTIPPSQQPNPIEAHKVDPNEYETIQEAEPEEHVQAALPQEPVVETITIDDDLTPTQRNSINKPLRPKHRRRPEIYPRATRPQHQCILRERKHRHVRNRRRRADYDPRCHGRAGIPNDFLRAE